MSSLKWELTDERTLTIWAQLALSPGSKTTICAQMARLRFG